MLWVNCKFSFSINCEYVENINRDEESEDSKEIRGHITSLSVLRTYRKLGLASQLMTATHRAMKAICDAKDVTLHVRVSNRAAMHLYGQTLEYK